MAKKRGQNEGTIYKRPNGTWAAQVTVQGRRLSKYARTRRECQAWLSETLNQIDRGISFDHTNVRLGEFLEHWLTTIETTVRTNTWRQYRNIIHKHIIPHLGDTRLSKLRADHLQSLYSNKLKDGVGVRTVQLIHSALHRALKHANEWDLIARNPATTVRKPKKQRGEMLTLDPAQVRRLLKTAEDSRHLALFHLAITTGLREAELLGLQWKDLDWDTSLLAVQRQLYRVTGQGLVFSEPKTKTGRRSIALSKADIEVLRQHRKQQLMERLAAGKRWQEQDLIFPSSIGTPLDQRNMTREFKAVLQDADLPNMRFHDLRHTAASLMLQTGVHPKIVQERLGHSDITVTLNTYSHVLPSLQEEAAEKLAKLLS